MVDRPSLVGRSGDDERPAGDHDVGVTTVDGRPEGPEPVTIRARTRALRLGVAIPLAIVSFPFLLLGAFNLIWWSPALTGPGPNPCDPAVDGWGACWRPEQRTFWIVAAAVGLPGAVCLVISLIRLPRTRRWWPWPIATAALLFSCHFALTQIP
ncbi:hypothetical protein GA0070214_103362 [Micromonospora chaiyaphumensis]|uniref:Uncharacterized protein n=1 Tax=Micromonospora chaiyaphumensis TaxID=307119 RepID=A0A1C4W9N7_9ACTN|nr:hypothetical protein GA0070214_103362 [Micromonospora chaiyaphumensis]